MGDILFGLLAVVLGAAATYGLYWLLDKVVNFLPPKLADKFKSASFLLPAAVLVILVLVLPMFQTIIWSFMNDDGKKFVGIENLPKRVKVLPTSAQAVKDYIESHCN